MKKMGRGTFSRKRKYNEGEEGRDGWLVGKRERNIPNPFSLLIFFPIHFVYSKYNLSLEMDKFCLYFSNRIRQQCQYLNQVFSIKSEKISEMDLSDNGPIFFRIKKKNCGACRTQKHW